MKPLNTRTRWTLITSALALGGLATLLPLRGQVEFATLSFFPYSVFWALAALLGLALTGAACWGWATQRRPSQTDDLLFDHLLTLCAAVIIAVVSAVGWYGRTTVLQQRPLLAALPATFTARATLENGNTTSLRLSREETVCMHLNPNMWVSAATSAARALFTEQDRWVRVTNLVLLEADQQAVDTIRSKWLPFRCPGGVNLEPADAPSAALGP